MKTVIQTYKMMFGRNPRTAASLLIFWMNIFRAETCHRSEYLTIQNECCPMCPPGNRVRTDCTEFRSTSCQPCYEGTYMNQFTKRTRCFPCAKCDAGSGLKIHTACTTTSDTVCEPLEGFYCLEPSGSSCMTARKHTTCKPGQYISQNGTAFRDTVCSECSDGTYSDGTFTSCRTHTQCEPLELQLIKPGTASTDAECGEQSANTMTMVGVVVGIVVDLFLSCGAAVFVFWLRKKKRRKEDTERHPVIVRMEDQPEKHPLRTTDGDQQQTLQSKCFLESIYSHIGCWDIVELNYELNTFNSTGSQPFPSGPPFLSLSKLMTRDIFNGYFIHFCKYLFRLFPVNICSDYFQ